MTKNFVVVLFLCVLPCVLISPLLPKVLASNQYTYSFDGIDIYGQQKISAEQMQKLSGLKSGACVKDINKNITKLQSGLEKLYVHGNIESVIVGNKIYLVVDITDSTKSALVPTRKLSGGNHIETSTEKPFLLLVDLNKRLAKLEEEGRPVKEEVQEGLTLYSDIALNQTIAEIQKQTPYMRSDFLKIIAGDPDPNRRAQAIQLLQFSGDVPYTAGQLVAALDDSALVVRRAACKYLFNRINYLPNDFPYDSLIEGLSHELLRPHHFDRSGALYCLYALLKHKPDLAIRIDAFCGKEVSAYAQNSKIPTIREPAAAIVSLLAQGKSGSNSNKEKSIESGF